jgi:hypothetical protein
LMDLHGLGMKEVGGEFTGRQLGATSSGEVSQSMQSRR